MCPHGWLRAVLPPVRPTTPGVDVPFSGPGAVVMGATPEPPFAELSPPYSTIVADPPWHYNAAPVGGSTPGSMGKAKAFPYSTMSVDEVRALVEASLRWGDSKADDKAQMLAADVALADAIIAYRGALTGTPETP